MGRAGSCRDDSHGCGLGKQVGRVEKPGGVPFSHHFVFPSHGEIPLR